MNSWEILITPLHDIPWVVQVLDALVQCKPKEERIGIPPADVVVWDIKTDKNTCFPNKICEDLDGLWSEIQIWKAHVLQVLQMGVILV